MKNLNIILCLCFLCFSIISTQAQKRDQVGPALSGFLKTDFMLKFQDMRGQAETMVKSFQAQSFNYPPADVARVQVSYDKTARRFNQILENIKSDFLNPGKLKLIASSPEYYGKGLELDMRNLSDFYAQNFQQVLADVTGNQIDGNPLVLIIVQLIGGISSSMDHFAKIKREARMYNEQYLRRHLIEPYRFQMWDEISGGVMPGGGFNAPPAYDPGFPGGQGMDPMYNDPMNQNQGFDPNFPTGQGGNNFPGTGGTYNPSYPSSNQGYDPNYQNPTYDPMNQNGNTGTYPTNTQTQGANDWNLPPDYNATQNTGTNNYNYNYDGGSNTTKSKSSQKRKVAQPPRKKDDN